MDKESLSLTGGQSNSGEWTVLTANDPGKLFTMRAAHRRVAGVASTEDEEILSEFYYRHFEITDETLISLREQRPDVYEKIGAKLARLNGTEYLSAEGFEARLKAEDVIGKDDFERHRRTLLKLFRMPGRREPFIRTYTTRFLDCFPQRFGHAGLPAWPKPSSTQTPKTRTRSASVPCKPRDSAIASAANGRATTADNRMMAPISFATSLAMSVAARAPP